MCLCSRPKTPGWIWLGRNDMLTGNKDLRRLLARASDAGWRFERKNRHIKGRHPDGRTSTVSVSPGGSRYLLATAHDLGIPHKERK